MKSIVISESSEFDGEVDIIHQLFENGLDYFHVRKPKLTTSGLKKFLLRIDPKWRSRVVTHSHHELALSCGLMGIHLTETHRKKKKFSTWLRLQYILLKKPGTTVSTSFHNISSLRRYDSRYNYVFISPIFESISKVGYRNTFNDEALMKGLETTSYEVMAMGGVNTDKIEKVKEYGFKGFVLLGALWQAPDPVEKFKQVIAECQRVENMH